MGPLRSRPDAFNIRNSFLIHDHPGPGDLSRPITFDSQARSPPVRIKNAWPLPEGRFDAIASWLALYHIPGRGVLLDRCRTLLADSGFFFAEDLYERRPFDGTERARLSSELFANELTSSDRYRRDLVEAGFEVVVMDDMTDDWTAFTQIRLAEYVKQRERHLRVHGEAVFETMCGFYETMVRLFAGGKLGGIRVVARRG